MFKKKYIRGGVVGWPGGGMTWWRVFQQKRLVGNCTRRSLLSLSRFLSLYLSLSLCSCRTSATTSRTTFFASFYLLIIL